VRVGAGASASAGFDRVIGLPCELVLETDPMAWNAGGAVVVLLNVEGTPMPDRQVKLMALAAPFTITLARTDEHGRARFTSDRAGPWVASAVHQRRAKPEQKLEGDWEGLWASLSFELGSAEPRPAH
jgi:uncharacterized GH25 family protein